MQAVVLQQHGGGPAGDGLADLPEQRVIERVAGADLQDLDPGIEGEPQHQTYVTDLPASFHRVAERFLGRPLAHIEQVDVAV